MSTVVPDGEGVALTGVANEFRIALRDEIEAARRAAASSATQLRDGRRISQIGASYQYQFTVESALQLPDDSPGDLYVEGRLPVEITVVAVEGLSIVVSVAEDLGIYIPRARLQSNMVHLLRRLIERIENLGVRENSPGDRLLGLRQPSALRSLTRIEDLDGPQRAVATSLAFDTAFIWGPPGTGKTHTIGTIGAHLARQQRSLLVVSHTNTAVDQAILAIADQLGDELKDGTVLRVGEPRDQRLVERPRLLARTHVDEMARELAAERDALNGRRDTLIGRLHEVEPLIAIGEWAEAAPADITALDAEVFALRSAERAADQIEVEVRLLSGERPQRQEMRRRAEAAIRTATDVASLKDILKSQRQQLEEVSGRLAELESEYMEARALYERAASTGALLRRWRGLPRPEEQMHIVQTLLAECQHFRERQSEASAEANRTAAAIARGEWELARFRSGFGLEPEQAARRCEEFFASLTAKTEEAGGLRRECQQRRHDLEAELRQKLEALRDFQLIVDMPADIEDALDAIRTSLEVARSRVSPAELSRLRLERSALNEGITRIDQRLEELEAELARVEEVVISRATVVATTLTRAYLRDAITRRRFGRVILDEASMAPIPALWSAASLADESVTAVGDFRQLPPIKHSRHPLAEKWLGSDVFEVAGIVPVFEHGPLPPWCAALHEQHRMHAAISAIPNALVYEGLLSDGPDVMDDAELEGWFARDWGHDAPVLLVDTQETNAWVTSVRGVGRSSRLNFLSATVCVDLAERFLRPDRTIWRPGDKARIMVGCPYRPHARLLSLLLREQKLNGEVVAGTAHAFQGSEAPVVIFDLVSDEPHWRVGMFNPQFDDTSRRLLNVALTRARRRLVVVGDFDWVARKAKRSFLGRLVDFLTERYPRVSALNVLPEGLAARAAGAHGATVGVSSADSSNHRAIFTQVDFFPALLMDLSEARQRIVIYSPFMANDRLAALAPHIQAASARGVELFVVTKTLSERAKREQDQYRHMEQALAQWGAAVIHKLHMHEKLVFVDDSVLWTGSLNVLSFSDTQEIMERRVSRNLVEEYLRTLRLNEMLEPYRRNEAVCPFCHSELFPAEGADDPYYWRCQTEGCHTRSIDQEPPRDGVMTCSNCGSSVHVGEWGGKPAWRCDANPRHRQPIVRTHLRLPTVRAMIPKRELARLDRLFGISS